MSKEEKSQKISKKIVRKKLEDKIVSAFEELKSGVSAKRFKSELRKASKTAFSKLKKAVPSATVKVKKAKTAKKNDTVSVA